MICSYCSGTVEWRGPISNLTHTECTSCGRTNCQVVEAGADDEETIKSVSGAAEMTLRTRTYDDALLERVAQLTAHRACCSEEHNPEQGKLHGCCVVCGVPWPCAIAAPTQPELQELSDAASDVLAERQRQISIEGWSPEHDDAHRGYELAIAAGCYAMYTLAYPAGDPPPNWPWEKSWWKPSKDRRDRRRNLVKAGALILAEIERIDRAKDRGQA